MTHSPTICQSSLSLAHSVNESFLAFWNCYRFSLKFGNKVCSSYYPYSLLHCDIICASMLKWNILMLCDYYKMYSSPNNLKWFKNIIIQHMFIKNKNVWCNNKCSYILNCIFYCTVLPLSLRAKDAISVSLTASELMRK